MQGGETGGVGEGEDSPVLPGRALAAPAPACRWGASKTA